MSKKPQLKGKLAETLRHSWEICQGTKFVYCLGIAVYNDEVRTIIFSKNPNEYVTGMYTVPNDFIPKVAAIAEDFEKRLKETEAELRKKQVREVEKEEKPTASTEDLVKTLLQNPQVLQLIQELAKTQKIKRD